MRRRARAGRCRRTDAGAMSTELVMVLPVFLGLSLSTVQAAEWVHARDAVQAAAREGLRAVEGGQDEQAATAAAEHALATLGGGLARDGSVRVVRLPDRVRVVVSADAAKLLPVRLGVTGSAESLLVAPPPPDPTATPDPAATPTPAATSEPAAGTGRPAAGAP